MSKFRKKPVVIEIDGNTGYRNTGDGNACDYSSGFFCCEEQPVIFFDKKYKIKRSKLPLGLMGDLALKLSSDEPFDAKPFLKLPNATAKKIKALHKKHIKLRKGGK